jgi:hypothetical protein
VARALDDVTRAIRAISADWTARLGRRREGDPPDGQP